MSKINSMNSINYFLVRFFIIGMTPYYLPNLIYE